jgi:hypothetical protein
MIRYALLLFAGIGLSLSALTLIGWAVCKWGRISFEWHSPRYRSNWRRWIFWRADFRRLTNARVYWPGARMVRILGLEVWW